MYDNKILGNIVMSSEQATGLLLNQMINISYISKVTKLLSTDKNVFLQFKNRYLFENTQRTIEFKNRDSTMFEMAVNRDEKKANLASNMIKKADNLEKMESNGAINMNSRNHYNNMFS